MILLDTDVCVELLRGNTRVVEQRRRVQDEVAISFMTVGELYYGAAKSTRVDHNRSLVECFLVTVRCLQSDMAVMERFGTLKASLVVRGEVLPDADILIAATALTHCDLLVSGNEEHYARIPGLRTSNWIR